MTEGNRIKKVRVGISTCLLGEKVRYDGGHKRNDFILNTLSQFFECIPVCPEVEMGLGTPRESLRLTGHPDAPRLVTSKTQVDHTDAMLKYARAKVKEIARLNLHGYILKKDSPSCGMERVRVYNNAGMPAKNGVGIFARLLMQSSPYLPVEEEGQLTDMRLRENFIVRVFCHQRWHQLTQRKLKIKDLVQFHAQHKFLLMAHSEKHLRALGRLVAEAKSRNPEELLENYAKSFFGALRFKGTHRKHTNVLLHILGYFKKQINEQDKQELLQIIEDYRQGLLPLIVPLTLLKHYIDKFDLAYIKDQVYLNPHPKELMLLNHV